MKITQYFVDKKIILPWKETLKECVPSTLKKESWTKMVASYARDIDGLRKIFNEDRTKINLKLITDKKMVTAYLAGFHLANTMRSLALFERLSERLPKKKLWSNSGIPTIIDLGCGSGSFSQACVSYFGFEKAKVILFDHSKVFLDVARSLLAKSSSDLKIEAHRALIADVKLHAHPHGQIVLMGYVLNEMSERGLERLLQNLKSLVEEKTALVITDPGTETSSRHLMSIRDKLVAMGYISLYPCPHQKPCPLLKRTRDWCYSEFPPIESKAVSIVDKMSRIKRENWHSTAFVFVSPSLNLESAGEPTEGTVVGRPLNRETKRYDYLVCSENGEAKSVQAAWGKRLRGLLIPSIPPKK